MRSVSGLSCFAIAIVLGLVGCKSGGGGESSSSSIAPASTPQPGTGANSLPTIQGQPATTILVGQAYTFQPLTVDADRDQLSFSATNLPAWLAIDTRTGQVSGTPGVGDIGTYAGITIVVSDGKGTAALGPFSVIVTASGAGSASLSWTPPTANTDETTLTNLAGYIVVYGRSATSLSQTIRIDNASVSRYVVENLTSGVWYFAVQAVNSAGATSSLSVVASKTIS